MVKKSSKAIAVKTVRVDPQAMLNATRRINSNNKSIASYAVPFGNLGDSIERRFTGTDVLGGGSDYYQGGMGTGSTYSAVSYGNYYGAGQGYGPFSRFGPWVPGSSNGGFQYLKRFAGNAAFSHAIIASCVMAYLGYGVVRNIIDLYADFATEGVEIQDEDKYAREFYTAWARKVKLKERLNRIFADIFTTGNVFVLRKWAKLSDDDQKRLRRIKGSVHIINGKIIIQDKKQYYEINPKTNALSELLSSKEITSATAAIKVEKAYEDDLKIAKDTIPWGYVSLNPLQMELRGKRFTDSQYWVMALDRNDTKDLFDIHNYTSYKELGRSDSLPEQLKGRLSKYQGIGATYYAEIKFDTDELFILQDRKPDYWDWAVPFVFPALRALTFKDCLRNMELRACESVINTIFLFKLGNIEKGMPAEEEHFERLADMLQTPGNVMNILWNEAIEAEVVQADVSKLFDPKKHESADKDILTALGVPEVLLGGKGGNFSNSNISVATVLEKINTVRDKVETWLLGELKIIADAMGFKRLPTIKWGKTNLTDKNAEKTLMTNLFDRGILSADTLLREFDTNFNMEMSKQLEEKNESDNTGVGVMDARGPYLKPEAMIEQGIVKPGWDEEHDINKKMENKQENEFQHQLKLKKAGSPKTANGRPGATKEPIKRGKQTNPRGPKGFASADLNDYDEMLEVGKSMLSALEDSIGSKFLQAKGLKYIKQAPQEERDRLEKMIYNVFSHMPAAPQGFNTDDFLLNVLQNNNITSRMKAEVLATYHDKIAKYEDKFGKEPDREHRRQFMVSAWTQAAMTCN